MLLHQIGVLRQLEGDPAGAQSDLAEALRIRHSLGAIRSIAVSFDGLGELARIQGSTERACRLFAAAEKIREAIHVPLPPIEQPEHNRRVGAAREALGEEFFAQLWAEGRVLSCEQAVAYALEGA